MHKSSRHQQLEWQCSQFERFSFSLQRGLRRCLAVSFRCLSAARMYIINFLLPHAYECSGWTNSVTKIALCQILTHNSVLSASLHFLTFISYNINYLLYIYNILTEVMKFSAKNLITPMSCNV